MADAYSEVVTKIKKELQDLYVVRIELEAVDQDAGEVEDLHFPLKRIKLAAWRLTQLVHQFESRMMTGLKDAVDLSEEAPRMENEP